MDEVEALIARHGAHQVDRTLSLFADSDRWTSTDAVVPIPLRYVLSEAWKTVRMERCREALAEGRKPPPVYVTGYRMRLFGRRVTLWSLGDGNHRCEAAKEAGRSFIKAKVSGHYQIDPRPYLLRDGSLWLRVKDNWWQAITAPNESQREILLALGVKEPAPTIA